MVHRYLKNSIIIIIISLSVTQLKAFNSTVQQELIRVSQSITENELLLRNLKEYQDLINLKQQSHIKQINQTQNNLNNIVISLYKMKHTPIQYLFTSNKSTSDIAVTYSLFNYYLRYLQSQLKKNVEYLYIVQANKLKLKTINYKIRNTRLQLRKNKQVLFYYLHKKSKMNKNKLKQINQFNKTVTQNNSNLYALMNEINNSYILKEDMAIETKVIKKKGKFLYPNNGFLIQQYHKAKRNSLYYNGILILSKASSQIIAPYDGEIIYASKFYGYGNVIIIKHSVSYFSVIAGKYNSFVKTSQLVKQHEPIAIVEHKNTPIYYELQYKNKPLNPMSWLVDKRKDSKIKNK